MIKGGITLKVTVIGHYGPFPKQNGACSGYLVEYNNCKILLDCGSGVMSRVQNLCDIKQIDAIVLTHLHSDHISDILVLRYVLDILIQKGEIDKPIPLYAPSQPKTEYDMLNYKDVFQLHDIYPDLNVNIKGLKLSFEEMTHPYKCYAIKIQNSDSTLVYTGDTSYNKKIINFANRANLFICDAAFLDAPKNGDIPHMTVRQASEIATQAKVEKLLLTHFWYQDDVLEHLIMARQSFENTEVAEEMKTYII